MNKRRALILLVITIIALLFWYSSIIQDVFYLIVNLFSQLVLINKTFAVFLFILVAAAAALLSPFTNIPLIPVAVAVWDVHTTILLLLFGWLLGDVIAYFLGYYLGRPVIRYIITDEKFDGSVAKIKEHTTFIKALFLRLALPAELGYVFGIVKYNFSTYFAITFLAELPLSIISVYLGEAALSGNILKFLELIVVLFIIVFAAFNVVHKKRS